MPVETRGHLRQIGQRDLVVGLDRVAVFHVGPLHLGQRGFKFNNGFGFGRGVFFTGQRQHFFHVDLVLGARVGQLLVVRLQVVIAVGHAQAALDQVCHILGRILGVLVDADVERHAHAHELQLGQHGRQFRFVFDRGNFCQLGVQWRQAQLLQLWLVHEAAVKVPDTLRIGASSRLAGRGFFDDRAQNRLRIVAQLSERAPARLVGRDFSFLDPLAVQVSKEIVLRAHAWVDVFGGHAGAQHLRRFWMLGGGVGAVRHAGQQAQCQCAQ